MYTLSMITLDPNDNLTFYTTRGASKPGFLKRHIRIPVTLLYSVHFENIAEKNKKNYKGI